MNEPTEAPIEEATNKSTGLAIELDIREFSCLLDLLAPKVVHPLGEEAYIVNLFIKLSVGLGKLASQTEGETMDTAAHIPDRASGNMTKQAGGHAEPSTKKPLRMKSVGQVMGEAPHMPAPRDTETARRGGGGGTSMKENAGS